MKSTLCETFFQWDSIYMDILFFIPRRILLPASAASLLYTKVYIMLPSAIPVATSNTECCLMNIVDRMMDTHKIPEANLIPLLSFNAVQRITAK